MNSEDLKKTYTVIVGDGSGCLFQPMTEDYTYILTAKHLFFKEEKDDQGQDIDTEFQDGEEIEIRLNRKTGDVWKEEKIEFELQKGENYFPHHNNDVDIAILKINYIQGFDEIFVQNDFNNKDSFKLCGMPSVLRPQKEGERYIPYEIMKFLHSDTHCNRAQLFGTFNMNNVEGMSGGGILSTEGKHLFIAGVQSNMANSQFPAGQIGFVPIRYFDDIVTYPDYAEKLESLHPLYMGNFKFLRDDAFKLEVDSLDESRIESTRNTLKNKALEIIDAGITPVGIKQYFKTRLLLNENDSKCLSIKNIWIAWLEFLIIMNVVKEIPIAESDLSEIFDSFRLKYTHVDDWTTLIRTDLLNSDYHGLKQNSTVIVSTKKPPKSGNYLLPRTRLLAHIGVPDKSGFKIDKGLDNPYNQFNFVHLDYFKTKCIIEKLDKFQGKDEQQLLELLKEEYSELFS